jgi:hypothetical protein
MIAVLGGLADVERDLIRTRTAEGRSRAKAQGQQMGRPPVLTPAQQKEATRRRARGRYAPRTRNWCYIETHDEKYCGHFLLRHIDFTPQKLSIELDRPRDNLVSVTFAMAATEFGEVSQVVKIISGEIEPPDARCLVQMSLIESWHEMSGGCAAR